MKAKQEDITIATRVPVKMRRQIERLADSDRRKLGAMVRILLEEALEHRAAAATLSSSSSEARLEVRG